MVTKISATPVLEVIATVHWKGWLHANLLSDEKGYELTVDLDPVPAMLTAKKTVKKRIDVPEGQGRYRVALRTLSALLTVMEAESRLFRSRR